LSERPQTELAPHEQHGVLMTVKILFEIVVIAIFVVTFIVQPTRIPSESMEPTLNVGDFLLVDKQSYGPAGPLDKVLPPERVRHGDLAIFHFALEPGVDHLVKRVVGLPGDRLHLHAGHVFVNGAPLDEPYAFYSPSRPNSFRDEFPSLREADPNVDPTWWAQMRRSRVDGEIVVPADHYFVLGDNRNNSEDSRYWGFVPRAAMTGKPLLVDFSIRRDATDGSPLHRLAAVLKDSWHSVRVVR
jgi:signal peptidase I